VRFHLDVAEQLRALSADADTPGGVLADGLDSFMAAGVHAVPSLLSVSLTVQHHGRPCTVSAQVGRGAAAVRSSLWLRLPGHAGAAFTVQAADDRALDQLGADLPALLDVHRDRVVLNEHLTPSTEVATTLAGELRDTSTIDRALGVFLDRGVLPEDGLSELQLTAASSGTTVAVAARRILAGVTPATGTQTVTFGLGRISA